ncbi:MAG: PPC domain-containing protein [Gemmataceae bacterium]
MRFRFVLAALSLLVPALAPGQALRHPDLHLHYLYPAGARLGQTVEVEFGGLDGLTDAREIVIDGPPGLTVTHLRPGKFGVLLATLRVAADAPVGRRLLRVAGGKCGLTNARPFFVGRLAEVLETEPNNSPTTSQEVRLPVVINARMDPAADVDCFRFTGRAGQKIVAAVLAQRMDTLLRGRRLGGFLDTTLELLDARNRVLATAEDTVGLDPVLRHTLPADGQYVLRVQVVFFKGAPSAVYRLTVGEIPYPTHAFPPGGRRGSTVELDLGGHRQKVAIPADAPTWWGVAFDHPLTDGQELPLVVGDLPERTLAGAAERSAAPRLTLPEVVQGRLDSAAPEVWYRIALRKGDRLLLEVTAQRHLRSAIDSRLRICDAGGKTLAENDDGALFGHPNQCAHDFPSSDSWLAFQAPADGDYFIGLSDAGGAKGPDTVYRLRASQGGPDFALWQWPDAVPVWGAGSTASFVVHMQQWGGLTSDVELRVEGLAPGWQGSVAIIPASYHAVFVPPYGIQALLTITAPASGTVGARTSFRVVGRARQDGQLLERTAQPLTLYGPSHTDRMHLRFSAGARAVIAPALECRLETQVREVTARVGETVEIPVRVHRLGSEKIEMALSADGPINGGAARCDWATPQPVKPDQTEVRVRLAISTERKPGVYGIVVSRAWAADLRAGRPGPCTPIIRLTILPAK